MITPMTSKMPGTSGVNTQKPSGGQCHSKPAAAVQGDVTAPIPGLPTFGANGALSGLNNNLGQQLGTNFSALSGLNSANSLNSFNPLPGLPSSSSTPSSAFAQVLSMLSSVVASLINKKGPGGQVAGAPSTAAAKSLAAKVQSRNATADSSQKQRLNTTLSKIAQDPDGAKLLQAALAKGYKIQVGDPSQAGAQDAGPKDADSINGVTIPSSKTIIISPNAPNFDKTVVHELVHAATEGDGNSQTEEGMADVIGFRVASRIDGVAEPGSEQQIFMNKIASYPNLNTSNDIINSLSRLGIAP